MAWYTRPAAGSVPKTEREPLKPLEGLDDTDVLTINLLDSTMMDFEILISTTNGSTPTEAARERFAMRFPERAAENLFKTRWTVPTTDVSVTVISTLWPPEQIRFGDGAGVIYTRILVGMEQQRLSMALAAEYHELADAREAVQQAAVVTPPLELPCGELADDQELATHQLVGLSNLLDAPGYGEFMEQGTGKTPVVIKAVCLESSRPNRDTPYRALVVCPKNVRENWRKEFEKFANVKGSVTVLRGLALDRAKLLISGLIPRDGEMYQVFVCSYEALSNMWNTLSCVEWDLGVLDEAHFIKWPKNKRSIYAFKLRDICKKRAALTGTPICNTPIDLYSQFEFLEEGGSGFRSFEAFQGFYGVYETVEDGRGHASRKMVAVQNLPFLKERLARFAFIVRKDEALPDLPIKTHDVIEVEMEARQAEIYRKVRDELYAEIEDELSSGNGRSLNAQNILTRLLRLAQITSGFVTYDPIVDLDTMIEVQPRLVDRIDPNPKVEELVEQLKSKEPDQKTIVWACWIQDIKTIVARLRLEEIDCVEFRGQTSDKDRLEAERRFNFEPSCKVFVGNPGCGGVGLNLLGYPPGDESYTTNCDHVIYFSQDWSHPKRSQSEDRAHRRGTRVPVRYSDLQVPGTIDVEIRERVLNKRLTALKVQDVREVLARVLGRELPS